MLSLYASVPCLQILHLSLIVLYSNSVFLKNCGIKWNIVEPQATTQSKLQFFLMTVTNNLIKDKIQ